MCLSSKNELTTVPLPNRSLSPWGQSALFSNTRSLCDAFIAQRYRLEQSYHMRQDTSRGEVIPAGWQPGKAPSNPHSIYQTSPRCAVALRGLVCISLNVISWSPVTPHNTSSVAAQHWSADSVSTLASSYTVLARSVVPPRAAFRVRGRHAALTPRTVTTIHRVAVISRRIRLSNR